MLFTLATTALAITGAIAAPANTTPSPSATPSPTSPSCGSPLPTASTTSNTTMPFGVISIRSGSDMQYASWGASQNMIGAGLSQQNASCNTDPYNAATFQIRDGALYLYSTQNPPQEVYVDRSGMGQGVIGYTTGAQPAVSGAERKGWAIDGEYLTFKGQGFIACPARDGFSVWVDTGVENPGFNKGCEGIAARTIETSNPADCLYSEQ